MIIIALIALILLAEFIDLALTMSLVKALKEKNVAAEEFIEVLQDGIEIRETYIETLKDTVALRDNAIGVLRYKLEQASG